MMSRFEGLSNSKRDWQVVPLPKLISDRIEDGFALGRESAKDEDDLGCDGFDDVAGALIVQEQVVELGNFPTITVDSLCSPEILGFD